LKEYEKLDEEYSRVIGSLTKAARGIALFVRTPKDVNDYDAVRKEGEKIHKEIEEYGRKALEYLRECEGSMSLVVDKLTKYQPR
jgi:hypothetical protein